MRIYLSPPHLGTAEMELVRDAIASNWVAPAGPHLEAFEQEFSSFLGAGSAVALSSGTAALHLALRLVGVGPGDEVLCSTLTFCASANPILYQGGRPVFIDSDESSWNMDPGLLHEELVDCAARGRLPRAVVVVDLYGQCADLELIAQSCAEFGVPLIEDAAEALGATCQGKPAGTFGRLNAFSFNGNKIITTSGGGMLSCSDDDLVQRARFLATQARDPAPHYQHSEVGYNYRLSNILAALGRGQLRVLTSRVEARRRNFAVYARGLGDLPGLSFMPEASYGRSTRWLTCLTIDPAQLGVTSEDLRLALAAQHIEARPVWKPLHQQPVYQGCRRRGGAVAERLHAQGLCLPSGSDLSSAQLDEVISLVRARAEGLADAGRLR